MHCSLNKQVVFFWGKRKPPVSGDKKVSGFFFLDERYAQRAEFWVFCCGTTCCWVLFTRPTSACIVNTCDWIVTFMFLRGKGVAVFGVLCFM